MAGLPYVLPFVLGSISWTADTSLTVTAASSPAVTAAFASPDVDLVVTATLTDVALRNALVAATDPQPTATLTGGSLHTDIVGAAQAITATSSPVMKLSALLADIDIIGVATLTAGSLRNATVDSVPSITVTPTAILALSGTLNTSLSVTDTPLSETAETRVIGASLAATAGLTADTLRTANVGANQSISVTESIALAAQFLGAASLGVTSTPVADSMRGVYIDAPVTISVVSEPVQKFSAFTDTSLTIVSAMSSSSVYSTDIAAMVIVVGSGTGASGVGFLVDGALLSVTTLLSADIRGGSGSILALLSVITTLSADMMLSGVLAATEAITVTAPDSMISNQVVSAPLMITGGPLADLLGSDVLLTMPLQAEVGFDQELFRQVFADTPVLESTVTVQATSHCALYADADLAVTAVFGADSQRFVDIDAELDALIGAEEELMRGQGIDCFLASMIDTPTAKAVDYRLLGAFMPFFYAGGGV